MKGIFNSTKLFSRSPFYFAREIHVVPKRAATTSPPVASSTRPTTSRRATTPASTFPTTDGPGATVTTTTTTTKTTTKTTTMEAERATFTDEDYNKFLEGANKDPMEGYASTKDQKQQGGFKTMDEGEEVPAQIQAAIKNKVFTSDADEPFLPVCLRWDGGGEKEMPYLPDEAEFLELIVPGGAAAKTTDVKADDIGIQDPSDWDPEGEYGDVLDAIEKAVKGNDVRVYRVARGSTRTEYFVVGCDMGSEEMKKPRLVGVKALGVES